MFIRSTPPAFPATNTKPTPTQVYLSKEELPQYFEDCPKVSFKHPIFLGLKTKESIGFLSRKTIQINNKQYLANTIFLLDKDYQIKESFSLDVTESIYGPVTRVQPQKTVLQQIDEAKPADIQTNHTSAPPQKEKILKI